VPPAVKLAAAKHAQPALDPDFIAAEIIFFFGMSGEFST
jgi:hypothetical protein